MTAEEAIAEILADPDHDQCRGNGANAEAECIMLGLEERGFLVVDTLDLMDPEDL